MPADIILSALSPLVRQSPLKWPLTGMAAVLSLSDTGRKNYGGKIVMARKGAFSDLDAAILVHPDAVDIAVQPAIACQQMNVEFFGKAAHASANPAAGINALDAMIYLLIILMPYVSRFRVRPRIHVLLRMAGRLLILYPPTAPANSMFAPPMMLTLTNCCKGFKLLHWPLPLPLGARLEYKPDVLRYANMLSNITLARLYVNNMHAIGREVKLSESKYR